MAPDDSHRSQPPRDGLGDAALTCGVVAMVFVFVPIVSDFLTLPAALAAVVLGVVGVLGEDRGTTSNSGRALAGGLLGVIAAFIALMILAATGTSG